MVDDFDSTSTLLQSYYFSLLAEFLYNTFKKKEFLIDVDSYGPDFTFTITINVHRPMDSGPRLLL